MSLPVGSRILKYLLFIFNLIFVLTGIILIVAGAVVQASYSSYEHILDDGFFSVPALLIVIGTIIFIVSFFGCCGAFKENYCMTVTFCACLILIFVLELSGGIAGYLLRDRVDDVLQAKLDQSMADFGKPEDNATTEMWNTLQMDLQCCGGKDGADSWITAIHKIPDSCCKDLEVGQNCTKESPNIYKDSCYGILERLFKANGTVLGGVGIGIALIELLGIIFACNLASSIRKDYESV